VNLRFLVLVLLWICPFIANGQIADIQFNGQPIPPVIIDIFPVQHCGVPGQGFLGLRGGALVFNDVEGSQCCPCFVGGAPDCGSNDNTVVIGPFILSGSCNITIRVEVSFTEDSDGLECDPAFPSTRVCAPNSGADGLEISLNAVGLANTLEIGRFCGNTPTNGNWTPTGPTSGFFEVSGLQSSLGFINVIGGTQGAQEEYRIERIVVDGDPFSGVPASINVTNNMPCSGQDPLILTAIGGNPGSTFQWSRNGSILPETDMTLNLGIANPSLSGIYELVINDPNGCEATNSVTISVQDCAAPIPDFTGLADIFCRDTDQLALPNVSNNGIPGTWNVNNNLVLRDTVVFNTLVFTPDPSTGANTVNIPIRIDEIPTFGDFPPNGKDICFFNTPGQTMTFDIIDEFNLEVADLLDIVFNGVTTSTEQMWRNMEVPSNPGSFDVEIFTLPFGACGRVDTITQLNISFLDMAQDNQETICAGDATPLNFSALVQSGNPDAVWSDLSATGADISVPSSVDLSALPIGQYTFQFDINPTLSCNLSDQATLTIDVIDVPARTISPPGLCSGDGFSVTVEGTIYDESFPFDEIFIQNPGGPCDSMITVDLTFDPLPERTIERSDLCDGDIFNYASFSFTSDIDTVVSVPALSGCDSSNRVMLTFNPIPTRQIAMPNLCMGETFRFDGVDYTRDTVATIAINDPAGPCDSLIMLDLTFNAVPTRYTVATVTRTNTSGSCDSLITLDLTFMALATMPIVETLCEGDTFTFDNVDYTQNMVVDVRVPDTNGGCDTIFNLDLSFTPLIRITLSPDLCEGDLFSYTANGNTYAEGQLLSGTERVLGPNGCDSVITVDLFFRPNSETRIEELRNSGDGFSQVVNGITFDESNPIDTITLPSANGCDSVIFVNLVFLTGVFDSLIIDDQCIGSGFSIPGGPNGPFDESNPSGIDTFLLADGRDSFFITRINFQDPSINRFTNTLTTGDPFSITFNGITYDATNPMGRDTLSGAAANGCDSSQGDPFSVEVDGVTYNEGNPVGEVTLMSADGIDSIVTIDLDFREPDTTMINPSRCTGDGFSVTVGLDTFDETNPSGTTPLINSIGCDSIVIVDLQFSNGVTTDFIETICSGMTITIGNTVFGEDTQLSGTEVLLANGGCDSTVMVMLTVDTVHFELITNPICPGEEEFDFMVINTRPGQGLSAVIDGTELMVLDTLRETLPVAAQDIVITNDSGCETTPPFELTFHATETLTIIESMGSQDSLTLTFDFTGIETSVIWSTDSTELCVDCSSVNVSSLESATYTVEVIDELGCTYIATFEVTGDDTPPPPPPARDTSDFFLPNVISASADLPNTSLYLQTVNPAILDYDLRIYNRWGNLIRNLRNLTPNDPSLGWDGRSISGDLQPGGVYVYVVIIRREGSAEQTVAGDLLLMQ